MRGFRSRMLRTFAASSFCTAATSSSSSVIVSALGGGSMGPASKTLAPLRDDLGLAARRAHDLDRPLARRDLDRLPAARARDRHRSGRRGLDRAGPGRGPRSPRSKEAPATGAPPQPEDRDEQQEEQEAEDELGRAADREKVDELENE